MKLACKDISPDTTCNFEVEAPTRTEAAQQMLVHARAEHAADIEDMNDEEAVKMFETKVREV